MRSDGSEKVAPHAGHLKVMFGMTTPRSHVRYTKGVLQIANNYITKAETLFEG
jgi:hypothetical protein